MASSNQGTTPAGVTEGQANHSSLVVLTQSHNAKLAKPNLQNSVPIHVDLTSNQTQSGSRFSKRMQNNFLDS